MFQNLLYFGRYSKYECVKTYCILDDVLSVNVECLIVCCLLQINSLAMSEDEFFASCADDGSLRVWSVKDREQTLQFQVVDQVIIELFWSIL